MPGVIMPVRVMDERLIQEIEEMKARGQAYVGTFLKRTEGESENVDPSDDMHDIGTFAQVQSVIRVPDISADTLKNEDEKGSSGDDKVDIKAKAEARVRAAKGEDGGGGATLLLLGHRRLRKTATVRHQPMVVQVDHIKDPKVADRDDDDVLKATANEVIATIKDLLKVNPLAKETLQYFAQRFQDFQDPAKLADLAASMCSADDGALQEILDTLDVRERLQAALVLLKKEVELGKLQADIGRRVEEKISGDTSKGVQCGGARECQCCGASATARSPAAPLHRPTPVRVGRGVVW